MTLVEFLTGIANAIRTRKETTAPINAQNFAAEILTLGPKFESIDITENGEYDVEDYKMAKVLVPNGDTAIGLIERNIASYDIPYGVEKIGPYALYRFAYSSGLSGTGNITIPNTVTEVLNNGMDGCKARFEIGDHITIINNYAFQDSGVTKANLVNTTRIGDGAFANAYVLSEVILPTAITGIGSNCFSRTSNLESLIFPDNIKSIANSAFQYSGLKSVDTNRITSTGEYAFSNCSKLESVILRDALTSLNRSVFDNCSKLANIQIGSGLSTIPSGCFENCAISNIVIPRNITGMYSDCISSSKPWTIVMENETPCVFYGVSKTNLQRIYVPVGSKETYINATGWSNYAEYIFEPCTIIMRVPAEMLNNEAYSYQVDNEEEWHLFEQETITLQNVATIKFKNTSADTTLYIGTTEGGNDVATIANATATFNTSGDTPLYFTIN